MYTKLETHGLAFCHHKILSIFSLCKNKMSSIVQKTYFIFRQMCYLFKTGYCCDSVYISYPLTNKNNSETILQGFYRNCDLFVGISRKAWKNLFSIRHHTYSVVIDMFKYSTTHSSKFRLVWDNLISILLCA